MRMFAWESGSKIGRTRKTSRSETAILLDHVIVPSRDPVAAAELLAMILDVPWDQAVGGRAATIIGIRDLIRPRALDHRDSGVIRMRRPGGSWIR